MTCPENGHFSLVANEAPERRPVRAGCDPVLSADPRVWVNLTSLERKHSISESYCGTTQRAVQPPMRRILTGWMLEVRSIIIKYNKYNMELKQTLSPFGL